MLCWVKQYWSQQEVKDCCSHQKLPSCCFNFRSLELFSLSLTPNCLYRRTLPVCRLWAAGGSWASGTSWTPAIRQSSASRQRRESVPDASERSNSEKSSLTTKGCSRLSWEERSQHLKIWVKPSSCSRLTSGYLFFCYSLLRLKTDSKVVRKRGRSGTGRSWIRFLKVYSGKKA